MPSDLKSHINLFPSNLVVKISQPAKRGPTAKVTYMRILQVSPGNLPLLEVLKSRLKKYTWLDKCLRNNQQTILAMALQLD